MAATIVNTTLAGPVEPVQNFPIDVPSGLQSDDVLVLLHRAQGNTIDDYRGIDAFTQRTPWENRSSKARVTMISTKVVSNPSEEPSQYTVYQGLGGGTRNVAILVAIRGLITDDLVLSANDTIGGDSTESTGVTIPALPVSGDGIQILLAGTELISGNSKTPTQVPDGFIELANIQSGLDDSTTSSRTALWAGYREVGAPSAPQTTPINWTYRSGHAAASVVLGVAGLMLDTPSVLAGATTHPSFYGASDGSQTVSWAPVSGAESYSAYIAHGSSPSQNDFEQVEAGVTSPYTFENLSAGIQAFGIRAEA